MDLDELLVYWERELEEDGARLDVMPRSLPRPIGETRIIQLSLKNMLFEIARKMPALDPQFETWFRYGRFYSRVYVFVFDEKIPVKLYKELCSSGGEFRTVEEAEEKAAEGMIRLVGKGVQI